VGSRGLVGSVKAVSKSVTVCRRVGDFYKGSKRGQGIKGGYSKGRGSRRLRIGGSVKVYIRIYKLPVNRTKT